VFIYPTFMYHDSEVQGYYETVHKYDDHEPGIDHNALVLIDE